LWPLIAAIGEEPRQERKGAEQGRHQRRAAIAVLDVGGMDDRMPQQALRIDADVALFARDLFAGVVTRRIDAGPPFSALQGHSTRAARPCGPVCMSNAQLAFA
jgi:hypothetical protein